MLVDLFPKLGVLRARLQSDVSERTALLILAGAAWLSFMLWVIMLAGQYNLYALWQFTQVSLYGLSYLFPGLRWGMTFLFVAQGILYFVALKAVQRAPSRDAWLVMLWGAFASGIALLFVYPIASTDIFDYINHGRILGVYGANPFAVTADQLPRDYFYPYVGWPGATSAYGPLWEILAAPLAKLVGRGLIANVIAFKLLSGAFYWGSLAVVAAIVRRVAPTRVLPAVLLMAWNPLMMWETFANGHNDVVMIFFILLAVWAMLAKRFTLVVLALLAGGLVKFIPVLMIPAAGLLALRDLPGWRRQLTFVVVTAVLGLGMVAALYAPFWTGPEVLSITRRQQLFTTSLPSVIFTGLWPTYGFEKMGTLISRIAALMTVGFALIRAFLALRDQSPYSFVRASFETLMFYLLLACPWIMPWYALWPLALAILLPPGRGLTLAHILAFSMLLQPVLFGPFLNWDSPPPARWQQLGLAVTTFGAAWIYVLSIRSPAPGDGTLAGESGSTGYLV